MVHVVAVAWHRTPGPSQFLQASILSPVLELPVLPQHISLDTLNLHQNRLRNILAQSREGRPQRHAFVLLFQSQWVPPTSSSDPTNKPSLKVFDGALQPVFSVVLALLSGL